MNDTVYAVIYASLSARGVAPEKLHQTTLAVLSRARETGRTLVAATNDVLSA